jgi:hypothetical protein
LGWVMNCVSAVDRAAGGDRIFEKSQSDSFLRHVR